MKVITILFIPFIYIASSLMPVLSGELGSSETSTAAITAGSPLFSAPIQCNKVSQITQWDGNKWICLADNFYVPPPPPPPEIRLVPYYGTIRWVSKPRVMGYHSDAVRREVQRLSKGRYNVTIKHVEVLKRFNPCRRISRGVCQTVGWELMSETEMYRLLRGNSAIYRGVEWNNKHMAAARSSKYFSPPVSYR